ncbi:MAG: DLW-39 family protein [Candidatus Nanopelagicales bacterium]
MSAFKKVLLIGAVAGVGYLVYRQRMASRAEDDLWSEATNAPDLTSAYQPVFDSPAPEKEAAPAPKPATAKAPDKPAAEKAEAVKDAAKDAAKDAGDQVKDAAKGAAGDSSS